MRALRETTGRAPAGEPAGASQLPRLLPAAAAGPASLAEHLPATAPARHPPGLAAAAGAHRRGERAGLTGRGGAAFPTAGKLPRSRPGGRPGGHRQRHGRGARQRQRQGPAGPRRTWSSTARCWPPRSPAPGEAVIVVHTRSARSSTRLLPSAGGPGCDPVPVRVVTGRGLLRGAVRPARWCTGSGTVSPLPPAAPPRLSERGLDGRPTLVQNVETLAHLALIARYGASWFRSRRHRSRARSMLVTLLGAVHRARACTRSRSACRSARCSAWRAARPRRWGALLIGGYFGTWADAAARRRRCRSPPRAWPRWAPAPAPGWSRPCPPMRAASRRRPGWPGIWPTSPPGQCGPCVFGLDAVAGEVSAWLPAAVQPGYRLRRWLGQVDGRGACHHPTARCDDPQRPAVFARRDRTARARLVLRDPDRRACCRPSPRWPR